MASRTVHARRLHRIPVQAGGWRLEAASIFPFFDSRGDVCWLMLVTPKRRDIFFLRNRAGTVATQAGGVTIAGHPQRWEDLSLAEHREITALFHYDPWWVLGEERFLGHEAVPGLKATNLAHSLTRSPAEYSRDLMQVNGNARRFLSTRNFSRAGGNTSDWSFDPVWANWERANDCP